jgi:hypothetical protein
MRHRLTDPAAIEAVIEGIPLLALDALRRRWRAVFGRIPPAALSKDLLGRMIAKFLDNLARHGGAPRRQLKPGTVLVRDYRGQRHTVTVAPNGFDWQGTTYASLSAIARAITGTAWSGPRFFALAPRNGTSAAGNNKRSARGYRKPSQPASETKTASLPLQTASQA